MDQKNLSIPKYKSISTGQACNAAQYAAELVCLRKREKENKGSLEFKFWNKSQKSEYEIQIRAAWKLINKYDERSLIRYLSGPNGYNVYALGFLGKSKEYVIIIKFVEDGVKKCFDQIKKDDQKEKKITQVPQSEDITFKRKSQTTKNSFLKLRKIDEKNKKRTT